VLTTAGKKTKDPEGRMPLSEHLRELRNRLFKSVLAIVVVAIVASVFAKHIEHIFQRPILDTVGCSNGVHLQHNGKPCAELTVNGLLGGFSLTLQVALVVGIVGSSPVWLYQLWAFLAPGLHRHEKRYTLAFVGAGVPLFLSGALLAYKILPQTARILNRFVPDHSINLLDQADFINLVLRMVIVFGMAFELPLVLVLLNATRLVSGRRMLGWWRGMVIGITVFAAVATPSGDPFTMLLLAAPIVLLYFMAMGICLLNDRRRQRRQAADPDFALDPDEASVLTHVPEQVSAQPFGAAGSRGGDGYDDAT